MFVFSLLFSLFLFRLLLLLQLFVHGFADDFKRLQIGVRSLRHRIKIFRQHARDRTVFSLRYAVLRPERTGLSFLLRGLGTTRAQL